MVDAYQTLGLAPDADETAIRQQYLELVRAHPPDRSPQRFAEIRAAYEELRDPIERLGKQLFSCETHDSPDAIIAELRRRLRNARIPTDVLLSLAENSLK
jgi:curved DNA-binding protein CbpA